MKSHHTLFPFHSLLILFLLLPLFVGCVAQPASPTPTPAPTPISTPFAGIREDPQRLTLIQTDLPPGFRRVDNASLHAGHHAVLFMNPDAVKNQTAGQVLGVVDEITTYEDDLDARDAFENDLRITEQDVAKDIQSNNDSLDSESLHVETYAPSLQGADLLRAFKVFYRLNQKPIYEYRYQFMVSNSIGNVIVTVRAQDDGRESEEARTQADGVAQAQLDKLNAFRIQPE